MRSYVCFQGACVLTAMFSSYAERLGLARSWSTFFFTTSRWKIVKDPGDVEYHTSNIKVIPSSLSFMWLSLSKLLRRIVTTGGHLVSPQVLGTQTHPTTKHGPAALSMTTTVDELCTPVRSMDNEGTVMQAIQHRICEDKLIKLVLRRVESEVYRPARRPSPATTQQSLCGRPKESALPPTGILFQLNYTCAAWSHRLLYVSQFCFGIEFEFIQLATREVSSVNSYYFLLSLSGRPLF